jgi:NADH:ubiquinone oxidoreductase subunit F (NADH-binding)
MLHEVKLNLTYAGRCVNPECRAPLYHELMQFEDDEACLDCIPLREGTPTAFRLLGIDEKKLTRNAEL